MSLHSSLFADGKSWGYVGPYEALRGGSGRLLLGVVKRGNRVVLPNFNRALRLYVGPETEVEAPVRQPTGDPRPSIAERYRGKSDYLGRGRQVAEGLVQARYLLQEDIDVRLAQADKFWNAFAANAHE